MRRLRLPPTPVVLAPASAVTLSVGPTAAQVEQREPASRLLSIHRPHACVFDRVGELSRGRQHPFLNLPWVVQSFPVTRFAAK